MVVVASPAGSVRTFLLDQIIPGRIDRVCECVRVCYQSESNRAGEIVRAPRVCAHAMCEKRLRTNGVLAPRISASIEGVCVNEYN